MYLIAILFRDLDYPVAYLCLEFNCIHSCTSYLHADILQLAVEVHRVDSAFASDAAQLDASERCAQVAQEPSVHPDHPALDLPSDTVSAIQVRRPDRGAES